MKKITYLEYYTVSIKNEGDDTFFVEVFQTEKKPKEWGNIELNIFDSWYDDLVYSTTFNSNYIWVRLKSKYGIGSITFIPESFDKKNKDYLIVHDYINKKDFKPVIGVFVHPNTQERVDITKKHLESLKKTNIPIYLCSNMGCPEELINLCDGYIYTGPNELCNVPTEIENKKKYLEYSIKNPLIIYPEKFKFYSSHSFINGNGTYLWSAAKSLKLSINFLKKQGYSHIMISEGEFILNELDVEKPELILKDMYDKSIVLDFFYTHNSRYLQAYLWFGEIKHLNQVFKDVTKKDKHYPKHNNNSNVNAFVLCEKYYQHKLLSYKNNEKIRVRTISDNVINILNRYWYTNRTEIVTYKLSDFNLNEYNLEEQLSFPLYFPNTKEVSLSVAGKNTITNNLNDKSFDLDISNINETNSVLIVKNNTKSKILDFNITLIDNFNNIILHEFINKCVPHLWYFLIFKTPIDKSYKCDYNVLLSDNGEIIYKGTLN